VTDALAALVKSEVQVPAAAHEGKPISPTTASVARNNEQSWESAKTAPLQSHDRSGSALCGRTSS
jgi:hypothetical protein